MKNRLGKIALALTVSALLYGMPATSSNGASAREAGPLAGPYISFINGATYRDSSGVPWVNNGIVTMTCGKNFNGRRAVNDTADTYSWIIVGGNFGSAQGSVILAGRSARITSWSPTKIVAYPTMPTNSQPANTTLTIKSSNGTLNYPVSIAPAIKSRVFGQCTHHVAFKRLALGLRPSPTAYSGYARMTTAYQPRVGDQLQWQGVHTAIIVAVHSYYKNGWRRFNIQVSEQNHDCKASVRTFWEYFEVGIVGGKQRITHYLRHPRLGNATIYYR